MVEDNNSIWNIFKNGLQQLKELRECPRELWMIYLILALDSFAYFTTSLILTSFLNELGYSDTQAGFIYALYGTLVSVYGIVMGFVIDYMGVKKALILGSTCFVIGRTLMAVSTSNALQLVCLYLFLPMGSAISSPAQLTGIRRYTGERRQAFGFSLFYTFMNIAALFSGYLVDIIRATIPSANSDPNSICTATSNTEGTSIAGPYRALLASSAAACVLMAILSCFLREVQVSDDGAVEDFTPKKESVFSLLREILCEPQKMFLRFLLFVTLLTGVKQIFRHLDATLPKYMLRSIGCDAAFGSVYSINPFMIIFLVPIVTSFTLKVPCFKQILYGSFISSFSVFFLTFSKQYWAEILFVIMLSLGEAIWSPRLYEYSATIAPKGREGTYMALASIPQFLAKFLVGSTSGLLLDYYCPCFKSSCEPCCISELAPGASGCSGGQIMWAIIGATTIISPILVLLFKNVITKRIKPLYLLFYFDQIRM